LIIYFSFLKFLVTGGLGFIGSNLIRFLLKDKNHEILNLDKITYASNINANKNFSSNKLYKFKKGDISNRDLLISLLDEFQPDYIMNLAAESHVDRSISEPADFINTNILGTFNLLSTAKEYWDNLKGEKKERFRFHHISTDEVYGSIEDEQLFTESSPYNPSSPYAASKASSDHLVRAWHKTYELPILISNCSNNYGPYQHPEKLIPLMILNALNNKDLPIYGNGLQVRDWLYVEDHVRALYQIILNGKVGETYNIGGNNQIKNIEIVKIICDYLDNQFKSEEKISGSHRNLIKHVEDRPGHDFCYGINASKINTALNWAPKITFEIGIKKTIKWYLSNKFLYIS